MPDVWTTRQARDLVAARNVGALVRLGRDHHGWTLAELGARLGCSPSTLSRLERSRRIVDLALIQCAATAVGMPLHILVMSLMPAPTTAAGAAKVAGIRDEEDIMRRRTLLAAAVGAVPVPILAGLDEALTEPPTATASGEQLHERVRRARALYDTGAHTALLGTLPALIGDAHAAARSRHTLDQAQLSSIYTLTSAVLIKLGRHDRARLTADRARTWADVAGSPLAAAAATCKLAVVLRHQGQSAAATRLMTQAAADVESTGLTTRTAAAAYAQMLCTLAYTAARAGQRTDALAMAAETRRVASQLSDAAPEGAAFPLTPAAVDLYTVGVHWALGDAGAALEAGRNLHPRQFPTAERRARMHTDLARAWAQWGKPEQTALELLNAARESIGEVRDRPAIHAMVTDLTGRHPRVPGVRELGVLTART